MAKGRRECDLDLGGSDGSLPLFCGVFVGDCVGVAMVVVAFCRRCRTEGFGGGLFSLFTAAA